MRSSCQEVAQQARAASLSHEDYLLTLVDQELDVRRRQGRIARALRASNLPLEKTLEGF
jgi:cyanophycinase-like exopeptidase